MMKYTAIIGAFLALCFLSGCNQADISAFMDHVHGGASVAVDPNSGAIIPSVSVDIKDIHDRVLFHAAAGVPVSKEIVHRLIARGAREIYPTNAQRAVSVSDPCGLTRAVAYRPAEQSAADVVDIQVNPSLREQLRNAILLRDRHYIRNSRPVERVLEKCEKCRMHIPEASTDAVIETSSSAPSQTSTASDLPPTGLMKGTADFSADIVELRTRIGALEADSRAIRAWVERH